MPVLDCIGKEAVVNHHKEVPYRLLHCDSDLSAGDPDSGNLLIQGDNLEALKALLPYYKGQVKCIFIDPPYNTKNETWIYNDNVNSPEIREWLGQTVNKDGKDLCRHDKWLCMMYPRLRLLKEFLKDDGVIFICIDDHEEPALRYLMHEIFGASNHLANIVWNLGTGTTAGHFTRSHEYVIAYARNKAVLDNFSYGEEGVIRHGALKRISAKNPASVIEFPAGVEFEGNSAIFSGVIGGSEKQELLDDGLEFENGKLKQPARIRAGWAMRNSIISWLSGEETFDSKGQKVTKIYFNKNGIVSYEKEKSVTNPRSVLSDLGSTKSGTKLVTSILGDADFPFPKPLALPEFFVSLGSDDLSIVLDSFAGTGTTGHSVLNLNKVDGGNRRFILIELGEHIAESVTAERMKRVIEGYNEIGDSSEYVEGLGGGFRFCRLGDPLFDELGDIAQEVNFPDLAAHIFFSETGAPLPQRVDDSSSYIGAFQDKRVYLLFSAANQGFPRETEGNVLTPDMLKTLPESPEDFEGSRVVYAEGCTVTEEQLAGEGVIFKQIPYEVEGG